MSCCCQGPDCTVRTSGRGPAFALVLAAGCAHVFAAKQATQQAVCPHSPGAAAGLVGGKGTAGVEPEVHAHTMHVGLGRGGSCGLCMEVCCMDLPLSHLIACMLCRKPGNVIAGGPRSGVWCWGVGGSRRLASRKQDVAEKAARRNKVLSFMHWAVCGLQERDQPGSRKCVVQAEGFAGPKNGPVCSQCQFNLHFGCVFARFLCLVFATACCIDCLLLSRIPSILSNTCCCHLYGHK